MPKCVLSIKEPALSWASPPTCSSVSTIAQAPVEKIRFLRLPVSSGLMRAKPGAPEARAAPSPAPIATCHVSQPAHLMGGHGSLAPGSLASGGRPFGKTGSASCRLRLLPGAASVQTKFYSPFHVRPLECNHLTPRERGRSWQNGTRGERILRAVSGYAWRQGRGCRDGCWRVALSCLAWWLL